MVLGTLQTPSCGLRITVYGAVQGVGFRPFVYRLAAELGLAGWIENSAQGVCLEVEGEPQAVHQFVQRLSVEKPPRAYIQHLESQPVVPRGYGAFTIRQSRNSGVKTALVLPDIATCNACLQELFNPRDRRYRYPFTNCTNCGPRFSIVTALPYDRQHTTMRHFAMCAQCSAEYHDPQDRRFHAQPNACPQCGPQVELWDAQGTRLAAQDEALCAATHAIRQGAIVAVKGLGGFHLMADARNEAAIQRLRQHKCRPDKPFALMMPCIVAIQEFCELSALESQLLCAPEAPIVLLRRTASVLPRLIAPDNPYLGVMLPYTPVHHLLMQALGAPVIATSGNRADEPLCIDEHEALTRLQGLAEVFLVHNRPIARHVDDSIVRVMLGSAQVLRRARGYAPLPLSCGTTHTTPARALPAVLAVGGHMKNTMAFSVGHDVFLSQHIGDLDTAQAFAAFQDTLEQVPRLYDFVPDVVACDAHPDYASTRGANRFAVPHTPVQHHYAHVLACMADNELDAPVLGVAWDGSGFGLDRTVWGGEFLYITETSFRRAAYFRLFPLPGGEAAVREPRRVALGLLYAVFGDALFDESALPPLQTFSVAERRMLRTMLNRRLHTPLTSSAGRLFDAVAALLELRQCVSFEGQAAMAVEYASCDVATEVSYPFGINQADGAYVIDWEPLVHAVLADRQGQISVGHIAARFHNTLADIIVAVAQRLGEARVALTGGCFQNCVLTARTVSRLRAAGFRPYWHHRIPPHDGGISAGQIMAVHRASGKE
jgi:hydrogenase maturation protein HypF